MIALSEVCTILGLPTVSKELWFDELCTDTRQLEPHNLFIAIPGRSFDAPTIITKAIHKGARCILTQEDHASHPDCLILTVPDARRAMEILCSLFYPTLPTYTMAVTGTDGKTSITHLWKQLWELQGVPSAAIGTMGVHSSVPTQTCDYPEDMSTPPNPHLMKILSDLKKVGVDHAAFEASSHALHQKRLAPLQIPMGIFTNFTRDHLDYHGTLEAYWQAKISLFQEYITESAVLFNGLPHLDSFPKLNKNIDFLYYGPKSQKIDNHHNATYQCLTIETRQSALGQNVSFHIGPYIWESFIPLIGEFQIANLTGALAAFFIQGGDLQAIIPLLPKLVPIKGRMDYAGTYNGGHIYVDFAHTPDGLENALKTLRPYTSGKMGVVFGCGGQRDVGKRPLMGKIAYEHADWVMITDDNPRNEDPQTIRTSILKECPTGIEVFPRERAIKEAMDLLSPGDILLIAGKGHETVQIIGSERIPFCDVTWIHTYIQQG
jgi:UDP-N-acetylmuramoyl-L-alanyl-D-glutamate--2,6-diaminopimelate ligase